MNRPGTRSLNHNMMERIALSDLTESSSQIVVHVVVLHRF